MNKQYVRIGVVVKPHGLKGAAVCLIDSAYVDVFSTFDRIFIEQLGTKVPFALTEKAPLNAGKFKVAMAGVIKESDANLLRGKEVYQLEALLPKTTTIDLVGFKVDVKGQGVIGEILEVIENPVQRLLSVQIAHEEKLIPLVDAFVLKMDQKRQTIYMELPEGLLEI